MLVSEKGLLITSVALTVIGFGVLAAAVFFLEQEPLSAKEFLSSPEVRVVLEGNITSVRSQNDMQFISFETVCELPGVSFTEREFSEGYAVIIGTKKYYQGKPEVIIESVKQ